ncbi:hypothetical protein AB0J47_22930 [Nocardia sp. NPDC049737]|uniref:hypothetical protein n=1 Tax=Nocardia sp. NPDC049737 TaxID=3154358 RepID=UPI00343CFFEF
MTLRFGNSTELDRSWSTGQSADRFVGGCGVSRVRLASCPALPGERRGGQSRKVRVLPPPQRLKELQRKIVPVDVTTATVKLYLEHWLLNVAKPEVRPTTYVTFELLVRRTCLPGLGKHKLKSLQANPIRTW